MDTERVTWLDRIVANAHKIYVIGIILIIAYTLFSLGKLSYDQYFPHQESPSSIKEAEPANAEVSVNETPNQQPDPSTNVKEASQQTTKAKSPTLTELVIEPIVTSEFNKIIFKGLFLYLIWILIFLLTPIALYRLKRFKLFNLEFEIEKTEAAAFEAVNVTSSKMFFSAFLTTEEFQNEIVENFRQGIDYKESIEYTMSKMLEFYQSQLGVHFSYKVYRLRDFEAVKVPNEVKKSIDKSKTNKEALFLNKSETDSQYYKNFLFIYHEYKDSKFITLLDSYDSEFDTFDKHLMKILHNLVNDYFMQYEYLSNVAHIRAHKINCHVCSEIL